MNLPYSLAVVPIELFLFFGLRRGGISDVDSTAAIS